MNETLPDNERKKKSETTMLERMRRGDFQFADLWVPFGAESPEYREADRLIQRERKAGRIRMVKHGTWSHVCEYQSFTGDTERRCAICQKLM